MLTNPPCTGTLTSKHWPCQTPRCVAIAGRFALSKPAETGTSVTSAAAECSAVVADVPVIFLSAYGQEETIARAFENGADDYVVKPFSPMELVARIKAALRKREAPEWAEPPEPFVLGELTVDYAERRVTLAGRPVQLTAIEYGLLFELSANAGRVMTYDRLLRRVWGLRSSGDSRRVRTAAKQLRRKLGDDANNPTYILNEPRVGYRMAKGETGGQEEA